jgi:hypothetical protein
LETAARRKGLLGQQAKHYEFGALNNMGAMQGNKVTAKGEAMERKHEADAARRGTRTTSGANLSASPRLPHIDNGHKQVRNKQGHAEKLRHA